VQRRRAASRPRVHVGAPVEEQTDDGLLAVGAGPVQRRPAGRIGGIHLRLHPQQEGHALHVPLAGEAHQTSPLRAAVPDPLRRHQQVPLQVEATRHEGEPPARLRVPVEGDDAADVEQSDLEAADVDGGGRPGALGGRRAVVAVVAVVVASGHGVIARVGRARDRGVRSSAREGGGEMCVGGKVQSTALPPSLALSSSVAVVRAPCPPATLPLPRPPRRPGGEEEEDAPPVSVGGRRQCASPASRLLDRGAAVRLPPLQTAPALRSRATTAAWPLMLA
jgi:hypothetical protein